MRSVDLVEGKLREATYFLDRMGDAGFNVWAFYCDFVAFLSSARSVTFTLQAVMSGVPEWPTWYEEKRRQLLTGPRGRFMVEMRNVTQKVGDVGLDSGMADPSQRVQHIFPPTLTARLAPEERNLDALTLCQRHIGVLVTLVQEWLQDFSSLWGSKSPQTQTSGSSAGLVVEIHAGVTR